MQRQQDFLNYLEQSKKILTSNNLDTINIQKLQQVIEQSELIVPIVGGFSAGKSTLINSFLNEELLPVGITPETALATELRYSSKNYIEAVLANNHEKEKTEIHNLENITILRDNAKNYSHIRIYLNNENLKKISPLVLVDMPGFDAPIEVHKNAILKYLNNGNYFIFLISIDEGTITRSMAREIENLQLFAKGFSFCISKANLRSHEDVENVKEIIQEQLKDDFDYDGNITLLNKNGGENLNKILSTINPEKLFNDVFIENIKEQYFSDQDKINTMIHTLKSDINQSEEAISNLQESINSIENTKSATIANIENRYGHQNINDIVQAVGEALIHQKSTLVDLAIKNQELFNARINDIIQDTLLNKVQYKIDNISQDIIKSFSNEIRTNIQNIGEFSGNDNFLERLETNSKTLLTSALKGMESLESSFNNKQKDIYRTIATIVGLTTSIVSPIIEVMIVFLPEILDYFTKDSKEKKRIEKIENQLIGEIIPQIQANIRRELPSVFHKQIQSLIQSVAAQYEEQLKQKQEEIKQAISEKNAKANEIQAIISSLTEAQQKLEQLANQYIFNI